MVIVRSWPVTSYRAETNSMASKYLASGSVLSAQQTAATHQTLVDRAEMVRASSNGVNVDEEMIMLIAQQQAFAAASRLVTVADEMVSEILRMV